jgi:RNA polymerase sigma-70 factor (ECF subfamily)
MDSNEIELIRRAQQGSTEAFDDLVRLHDRQIFQMIFGIVGNSADTCDIYQETFIRAFQKIGTFRFESELSTWLGRIAINLSINWRKRQRRKEVFSLEAKQEKQENWQPVEGSLPGNTAENRIIDRELLRHINKGLQQLPMQQRTVFVLKHMHGHKIKEIAEMMGCAQGTVKNHLFRATDKLQKILQPYYRNEY